MGSTPTWRMQYLTNSTRNIVRQLVRSHEYGARGDTDFWMCILEVAHLRGPSELMEHLPESYRQHLEGWALTDPPDPEPEKGSPAAGFAAVKEFLARRPS